MYMSDDNKPIGWWLKEVDRLLEQSFEQVLSADGLNRRQWQLLNAARGDVPIATALAPFLSGGPAELESFAAPLAERGWLDGDRLTPEGAAALEQLTGKVEAQRRRVTNGIVDAEYLQTVDVLRRMAANLGHEAGNGSAV
ncbi:MarR family winged helix-turn-helix transcriptional regulator [Kribbella sp. CA-294648]|uniref:MarR family winged helix-turn-helix transcriptional regulator n=1 Tax=Kribbella sp. CA-294648 TaxID=3239948 RepID=UPI003D924C26